MTNSRQPITTRLTLTSETVRANTTHAHIAPDCRHYLGDRPCTYNQLCNDCKHYDPYSHNICIIKLGALGDVIRTLCILPQLRKNFPAAKITWVTMPNGCRMLAGHPMIDRLMEFDHLTNLVLTHERFDTVISLDKEPAPCALAMSLQAHRKLGIGLSEWGTPVPLNEEAHAYFHLGLSDHLKFTINTKSYPQLIYQALGMTYQGQRYELPVTKQARERIRFHLATRGWKPSKPSLGINVGAGHVFANKMWPAHRIADLITLLQQQPDLQILLLGGPEEKPIVKAISARLRTQNAIQNLIDTGTNHDEPSFVALVDTCDTIFCGDTMAMHVAIARHKPVVVYFGPTCHQEIDLFGQGEKIIATVPCAPCYKRHCDHNDICVLHNQTADTANAIQRIIEKNVHRPEKTIQSMCKAS